ncbi:hypothetical protein BE20_24850 [Sorangium cellulosum]|uniref:Tail fiber protein n=1 Tax=Sorangium cellulosum TaxID=56 RepID=A0A150S5V5_SORCE|nr:hypothetical protein BE20_24850 [Sorangium cellulosum]KYF89289.1 hypothetical protein BE18_22920 [Sorangium cellulosum]
MALTRTKNPDWGVNEKLTSAQINALDANVTNALDKRAGQTDTLASNIEVTGTVAFRNITRRRAPVFLTDATQTVDVSQGNIFVLANNPAATRIITLRQTSAPLPTNGDWMRFYLKLGAPPFHYTLRREGSGNDLAFINGYVEQVVDVDEGAGTSNVTIRIFQPCFAEVQLVSGVWRLVASSSGVDYSTDA